VYINKRPSPNPTPPLPFLSFILYVILNKRTSVPLGERREKEKKELCKCLLHQFGNCRASTIDMEQRQSATVFYAFYLFIPSKKNQNFTFNPFELIIQI